MMTKHGQFQEIYKKSYDFVRQICRIVSGRNNNNLGIDPQPTQVSDPCYDLLPVQYTEVAR